MYKIKDTIQYILITLCYVLHEAFVLRRIRTLIWGKYTYLIYKMPGIWQRMNHAHNIPSNPRDSADWLPFHPLHNQTYVTLYSLVELERINLTPSHVFFN